MNTGQNIRLSPVQWLGVEKLSTGLAAKPWTVRRVLATLFSWSAKRQRYTHDTVTTQLL